MAATLPEWTKGADLNEWAAEHGGLPHIYRIIDGMSNGALQRLISEKGYPKRLLKHAKETLASRGVAEQAVEEVTPATAKVEATEGKVGYVRQKIREAKARREAAGEAPPARTPSRAPAKARKEPAPTKEPTLGGRSVREMSKAELYDQLDATIPERAEKAIKAELRRRGKPLKRPTGAMREVIKGNLPREEALSQKARREMAAEDLADTPGREESTEQTVGMAEAREYVASKEDPRDALIAKLRAKLAEAQAGAEPPAVEAAREPDARLEAGYYHNMPGAGLRDLAAQGDSQAVAEMERRAAKREAAGKPPLGGAKAGGERLKGTVEDTRRYVMEGEEGAPVRPPARTYPAATGEENLTENLDWRGLDELGDYSHKRGQVIYGQLNGEWVHVIPVSTNREDGSVDVKMAGQGENAERFRITPADDFRFIAPLENERDVDEEGRIKRRDQDSYNPPISEPERLLREEAIRARQQEPLTRDEELGTTQPREAPTERTERLASEQRGFIERQTQLIREMKRRGWSDEDIRAAFASSRREEEDVFNRNRMARRQERVGYSDAVEDYETWRALSPDMPPSTLDQVWRSALQRAGWMGRTIPPRPDEGKGGQVSQMTALGEPFQDPVFSRLVRGTYEPGARDWTDIDLRARAKELAGEQYAPIWAPETEEALRESLAMNAKQPAGTAAVGPEVGVANPDLVPPDEAAAGLGQPPFSNFAPLPEGEQGLGGTALPGMAPGERARLKGLVEGGGAPAPSRLERQLPGFAAGAEPSAVPPTTIAPEDLRNALQSAFSQVGGQGGPVQDTGEFLYRNTLENLVNLFSGGGQPATPGVPVPGGVPAPAPAVAGFGAPGLDQMMLQALQDPANRPVYALTGELGPVPMNTQGGMEDAGRALAELIGMLIPGYQQTLEG